MRITIENLQHEYKGGVQALQDINLDIKSGFFGLVGPNGAGKTTLMRILVTLLKPTSGRVQYDRWDLDRNRREIRALMGYLPQEFTQFPKLRTWEFLNYVAAFAGIGDKMTRKISVDEMLEGVGLYDVRERMANKLSGGMKRRLGIAQALIGSPRVVIVDEPTTGLDPEERIRFRNLLAEMSQKDIIILLSTHIVGDISSTCTDMAVLDKGRLAFNGSPEKLIETARGHVWSIKAGDHELPFIKEKYSVISTLPAGSGWEVQVVAEELRDFKGKGIEPTLEHAYIYFMEHNSG